MEEGVTIYVDADATPKDALASARQLGEQFGVKVITVSSINHHYEGETHVSVDAHPQAVDMEIIRLVKQGSKTIVVTQDYGLAAIVLGKGAFAISPRGTEYTAFNIDRLLFERDLHAKERRATGRSRGPKARTTDDAKKFRATLQDMLERITV